MCLVYDWNFLVFLICLLIFIEIKILLKDSFAKGVETGIKKGLGKPIEDLKELQLVLGEKDILILFFIPERDCGIFLAETRSNDITGEGIIYCKVRKWELTDNFHGMNPKPGKTYKFSVVDGTAMFIQK